MVSTRGFVLILWYGIFQLLFSSSNSFQYSSIGTLRHRYQDKPIQLSSQSKEQIFDDIVNFRSACPRFQRHSDIKGHSGTEPAPEVVQMAKECLDLARRSPSGFNAQPYRAILVQSPKAKEDLSKFCIGRNADRVRDSDCSVVFLADKECGRDGARFGDFVRKNYAKRKASRAKALNDELNIAHAGIDSNTIDIEESIPPMSKWAEWKIRILVLLFSSGYPFPRWFSSPFSFCVRFGVSFVSSITRRRILVPSLSGAETWATKNTMLYAMTYMLAASSRNLSTCPMEGFNAGGVRKALKIPRRYAVSLIVSTGIPYVNEEHDAEDDVGMSHGVHKGKSISPRYPEEEVVFTDYMVRS